VAPEHGPDAYLAAFLEALGAFLAALGAFVDLALDFLAEAALGAAFARLAEWAACVLAAVGLEAAPALPSSANAAEGTRSAIATGNTRRRESFMGFLSGRE
jgi:hypothetical protein